jgi:DNA-binding NtrC family response regulator
MKKAGDLKMNFDTRDSNTLPTVMVATADGGIWGSLNELLQSFSVRTRWVSGVEEASEVLARQDVSVCLCGFWLADGTYRELVKRLKREAAEIPVIILCAPACPNEYRDYLAAMNIGAFDFLCHPYRKLDLDRALRSGLAAHFRSFERVARSDDGHLNARPVELSGAAAPGIDRAAYGNGMQNAESGRSLAELRPDSVGKE